MVSITVTGLSKHHGPFRALDDVDIEIAPGEFVTILGPSGSGKTTMLSLMAGLMQPTRGRIRLGGRDVTDLPAAKRNIGLVFQSYALFPHMSVFDNIAFPLAVRSIGRAETAARVQEALEQVRLTGLEHRRPAELSGGQQQRVALARAIVFKPDVLLLDEPLAALDRKLREDVQVQLRHLQRSLGITTLLVTHDQEEALSLSDRVVVLAGGRIQQIASPAEAYMRPATRFVAGFLGLANFFDGVPECSEPGPTWAIRLDSGDRIRCADPLMRHSSGNGASATAGIGRALGRVTAMLRPERIRLEPPVGRGCLAAIVREAVYLGKAVRYHLETATGFPIIAMSSDGGALRPWDAGDRVHLAWSPQDVWIIPETADASDAGASIDTAALPDPVGVDAFPGKVASAR
jgi:ABC-type Fe3+/spermidine/putrescine transport system ATPase subunit